MVIQVMLRRKTASSVKIFIGTEVKTSLKNATRHSACRWKHSRHALRSLPHDLSSLSSQSGQDLVFGFVDKRFGNNIIQDTKRDLVSRLLKTQTLFLKIENAAIKNSSKQFLSIKLAWIDWFPCSYNEQQTKTKGRIKLGHVTRIHFCH